MLLFTRILDFQEGRVPGIERRREQRHIPGKSFPVHVTIEVDGEPRSGRIVDLSPSGIGLQVSGPPYSRGSQARVHLALEEFQMEFSARVAHLRALPVGSRLGLTALFSDFAEQKAYLQLLIPVATGSAFRAASAEETLQLEPDFHKIIFTGRPGTELNLWRQGGARGPLCSFVCQIDDYVIQGGTDQTDLRISSRKCITLPGEGRKKGLDALKLPKPVQAEVRQLFRWTMMNLSQEIPAEIRTLLQGFGAQP